MAATTSLEAAERSPLLSATSEDGLPPVNQTRDDNLGLSRLLGQNLARGGAALVVQVSVYN